MNFQTADILFSQYIKLLKSVDGFVTCCYCGKTIPIDESQNCHFVKRANVSVRFDERNCSPGCQSCNYEDDQLKYEAFLEKTYGPGTAEELRRKGRQMKKFSVSDLKDLEKELRMKINELIR